jgi:hypothetical protein
MVPAGPANRVVLDQAGDTRTVWCSGEHDGTNPAGFGGSRVPYAGDDAWYTSNKLTLAQGFSPPTDVPSTLDIVRLSVGTDPNLALMTRKGTGYYKVPSLKGVWYRGRFTHDGSVASLEEMFDLTDSGAHTPPAVGGR